jgi:hypothetical protein
LTRTKNLRRFVRIFSSKCVVIMPLQARLHNGLSFTSRAYVKKMTAHFAPYLEGCSLAITIISTALQEFTVLRARMASRCERLVLLLLTVVVSKWSKCVYAGQQYVSDVVLFPTLRDVTNRHS